MLFAVCLLLCLTCALGAQKTISGHYNFTVIHEPPYVDLGVSDGSLLPKDQWKGYIIDMIKIISQKAGFTYELFIPSGNGVSCPAGATDMERSNMYLCGQQDTLDLNLTNAYWSQFFVTADRVEAGTLFTSPFMTDVGLGLLVLPSEPSAAESFSLLFSPFSWEMWLMTFGVVLFVAVVVWLTEVVDGPSRAAQKKISSLTSTVYRKTDTTQVEQFFLEDGDGKGLFDSRSYMRFPTFFLGTFSGLMNASDDSEPDEGRVTPSGPFAAAWCFFVLFWASAYTANLAATLTTSAQRSNVESLDHLNRIGASVCASEGAAYTADLIGTYPSLNVQQYSTKDTMIAALQNKECEAMVESYSALNAIANGVTDLDATSNRNFCDVEYKMLLAGEPLATGFTDMAVGVSSQNPELRNVIDYWITALRTCSPSDMNGVCPQSGVGGGVNLEILRAQYVDQANCGDSHLSAGGAVVLGIANFFFPILAVTIAGIIMIMMFSIKYLRRMIPYLQSGDVESILSDDIFMDCFVQIDSTRRALMLNKVFELIKMPEHDHLRAKLVRASARYFLLTDLRSFFSIVRLGHILYPGHKDYEDPESTRHLKTAGKVASEVEAGLNLLIIRAVTHVYHENGTLQSFTFVCRDEQQFERMRKAGFGDKEDVFDISIEDDGNDNNSTFRGSNSIIERVIDSMNGSSNSRRSISQTELMMKNSSTVPYA